MSNPVDHLVFATPNLQDGIDKIETLLGVKPSSGGSHPGIGTANALLSLGQQCYLEIIGPDPTQTDFQGTRPFSIDSLDHAQLVTWAAQRTDLEKFVLSARSKGVNLSDVIPMSRANPDGDSLSWELAFPNHDERINIIPFFIDWGSSPHPSAQCIQSALLKTLVLEHPNPSEIAHKLEILDVDVEVRYSNKPGMRALIGSPLGEVEIS